MDPVSVLWTPCLYYGPRVCIMNTMSVHGHRVCTMDAASVLWTPCLYYEDRVCFLDTASVLWTPRL